MSDRIWKTRLGVALKIPALLDDVYPAGQAGIQSDLDK